MMADKLSASPFCAWRIICQAMRSATERGEKESNCCVGNAMRRAIASTNVWGAVVSSFPFLILPILPYRFGFVKSPSAILSIHFPREFSLAHQFVAKVAGNILAKKYF